MKVKNISFGKRKKPVIVGIAVHISGRIPEKYTGILFSGV
jgi:hypothetical protein